MKRQRIGRISRSIIRKEPPVVRYKLQLKRKWMVVPYLAVALAGAPQLATNWFTEVVAA